MRNTDNFPRELCAAYAEKKISRTQFVAEFSAWQRTVCGDAFVCKGTFDKNGLHISYRGFEATVKDGVLWYDRKNGICSKEATLVSAVAEFRQAVDTAYMLQKRRLNNADIQQIKRKANKN